MNFDKLAIEEAIFNGLGHAAESFEGWQIVENDVKWVEGPGGHPKTLFIKLVFTEE